MIEWQCSRCEDEGVIHHWEETSWDRRSFGRVHPTTQFVTAVIEADDYRALDECIAFSGEDESLVFGAVLADDGVVLRGTRDDLDLLADAVGAEALHERRTWRRNALDRICDRLAAAVREH